MTAKTPTREAEIAARYDVDVRSPQGALTDLEAQIASTAYDLASAERDLNRTLDAITRNVEYTRARLTLTDGMLPTGLQDLGDYPRQMAVTIAQIEQLSNQMRMLSRLRKSTAATV